MSTIITIIIITLLLSAFFSGIEIAFISSNRLKLELDRNNNSFISRVINIFSKLTKKLDEHDSECSDNECLKGIKPLLEKAKT